MSGFTPHGKHLIGGEWVAGEATFKSSPAHGPAHDFAVGTPELVARACAAAAGAFDAYAATTREERARFLEAIADEIEARAEAIVNLKVKGGAPDRGAARIVDFISVPLGVATLHERFADVVATCSRILLW